MFLYKYLAADRSDVLRSGSLRFTQADDFNDPFELVPNVDALLPPEQVREWLREHEDSAKQQLKDTLREKLVETGLPGELAETLPYELLQAFGADFVSFTEKLLPVVLEKMRSTFGRDQQRRFGKRIGILSLAEEGTNLLMWAHYADCHRGFALEFDATHPFFDQRRNPNEAYRHVMKVVYARERPAITMFDRRADPEQWADKIIEQVLLTKSVDWSYEREWRMLLPLDEPEFHPHEVVAGRYHLFPFPPKMLRRVIIGCRCTEATRAEIFSAVLDNGALGHVGVYEAVTSDRRYEVVIRGPLVSR